VYRDPTQRLNDSGKDSLEKTMKQRSILDSREFIWRMENGRSNTDSTILTEGVSTPPEISTGLFRFSLSCVRVFLQRSYRISGSDSPR
jgi:hypothetical protein